MKPDALEDLIEYGETPVILDVRSGLEYKSGHIPGAIHAPVTAVLAVVEAAVDDKGSALILVCEHGPRAQMAKFFLRMRGYRNLELLDGHMARWRSSGRPMQTG